MKSFVWFTFFLLVGCARVMTGADLDNARLEQIVKGKTSKDEILKILGEPSEKATENGTERWIFVSRVTSASPRPEWLRLSYRGDVKDKRLTIIFDQNLVKDILVSESTRPFNSSVGF